MGGEDPKEGSNFSNKGSEFGGVASRVPWEWRDSYGKTEILAGWVTKNMFKMYKKAGVGPGGRVTFDNIFKSSRDIKQ